MKIKNQLIWKEVEDYVFITLGLMLYAFAFTIFLMPYKIVTGGVTGTAAIVFYATKIPIQDTYMVINGLLLVVALKILGLKFLLKTIYAIFMLAFLLWLAGSIAPTNPDGSYVKILGEGQDFMSLLIGCTLTGTSLAIVFMNMDRRAEPTSLPHRSTSTITCRWDKCSSVSTSSSSDPACSSRSLERASTACTWWCSDYAPWPSRTSRSTM